MVNEVLCYMQNNISKHPRALISTAVNGFYTDDEVSAAKQCIYGILEQMKPDGLPRFLRRQPGDAKRKLECEDILNFFAFADGREIILPVFAASKLDRLPTVSPGDVDVYALAATVSTLTAQVDTLTKRMDSYVSVNDFERLSKRLNAVEAYRNIQDFPPLTAADPTARPLLPSTVAATSWTSVAGDGPGELNKRKPPVIRVRGSGSSTNIKAVPRPKMVSAFVGRLSLETTEDDLMAMLELAGISVIRCRKLKPKSDTWKTAAFYVACAEECKDVFYNEDTWPEGVELRDWYYKS